MLEALEEMVQTMREEHRLKLNTDYSYTFKYGVLRIFCDEIYKDTIVEYAMRYGLTVASYHTYEGKTS
jgi:hypothetical protein